jgi:hypothetical protein
MVAGWETPGFDAVSFLRRRLRGSCPEPLESLRDPELDQRLPRYT